MQRPRAFPYAKAVRQWKMPDVYREFLTALSQPVNGGGVPEFLRVMAMGRTYGPENLGQAMRQALSENIVDAERVRQLISRGSYPVNVSAKQESQYQAKVILPDLRQFDQLRLVKMLCCGPDPVILHR